MKKQISLILLCFASLWMCKVAIVSIAVNDDYLIGARVLHQSLRDTQSKDVDMLLYVSPDLSAESKEILRTQGWILKDIEWIKNPWQKDLPTSSLSYITMSKLNLWKLVDYDVVIFLDADIVVVDDLSPLLSCPFFCAVTGKPLDWMWNFNVGVMVLRPSLETHRDMMNMMVKVGSNHKQEEAGFLNLYMMYRCVHQQPIEGIWKDVKRKLPSPFLPRRLDQGMVENSTCYDLHVGYNFRLKPAFRNLIGFSTHAQPQTPLVHVVHYSADWKPWHWVHYTLNGWFYPWYSYAAQIPDLYAQESFGGLRIVMYAAGFVGSIVFIDRTLKRVLQPSILHPTFRLIQNTKNPMMWFYAFGALWTFMSNGLAMILVSGIAMNPLGYEWVSLIVPKILSPYVGNILFYELHLGLSMLFLYPFIGYCIAISKMQRIYDVKLVRMEMPSPLHSIWVIMLLHILPNVMYYAVNHWILVIWLYYSTAFLRTFVSVFTYATLLGGALFLSVLPTTLLFQLPVKREVPVKDEHAS